MSAASEIECLSDANEHQALSLGGEVLEVRDIARVLRVGRNAVYGLVSRNEIPHRRIGKQIRFSRAAVMRWLSSWSLQVAKKGQ